MTRSAIVAVDLGTTNGKAYAFDDDGAVLAEATVRYPLHTPEPGCAEQDATQVRDAGLEAIGQVVAQVGGAGARVRALSLSGAMHTLVGLDERGAPVTPGLTYADSRAAPQAAALGDDGTAHALHERTGMPVHPSSPLAKLRWYAEERPELAGRVHSWASIKELLLRHLTGRRIIDRSMAATSGMLALGGDWDEQALRTAHVERAQLAELVTSTTTLDLDPAVAKRLDLRPDTALVVGASDGCLANLGSGVVDAETAALSIGTSGALRVTLADPVADPALFSYPLVAGFWVVGGAVSNGGLVLDWLLERFMPELAREAREDGLDPHGRAVAFAAEAPAGADGLLFVPALTGERAPSWNPGVRGTLVGLARHHDRRHVLRAALEGIALQLRWVLASLREAGTQPQRVHASGGFTNSRAWVQLVADVLQTPVAVASPQADTACRGAALLARVALDGAELAEVAATVPLDPMVQPASQTADLYADRLELYRELHERLHDVWTRLHPAPRPGSPDGP